MFKVATLNVQCTVVSIQYAVYIGQCTPCVVQYTVYIVQWLLYSVQCTLYIVQWSFAINRVVDQLVAVNRTGPYIKGTRQSVITDRDGQ